MGTQVEQPVVETPPAPPPPLDVDESGVPWKNRAAEFQRKFEQEQQINQRYQVALGQQVQPPKPVQQELESKFDSESQQFVDARAAKIAEQTAYRIIARAQMTQEISADTELQRLANEEYGYVNQNPLYSGLPQEVKESLAVANAKAKVFAQRLEAAKKGNVSQAHAQAVQAQAAAASIPGTAAAAPSAPTGKDQYIREYVKEWTSEPEKRKFIRGFYKLDPDSPEALDKIKRAAEEAYKGVEFGGKTGAAIDYMTHGGKR